MKVKKKKLLLYGEYKKIVCNNNNLKFVEKEDI